MSFSIRVLSLITPVHCITQTEEPVNAPFEWNTRNPSAVIMAKLRGCLTDGSRIEEGAEPQEAV